MHPILTLDDLVHALNNSLSVISGHAQHLLTKPAIAGAAREDLMIIHEQAEHAAKLLDLAPRGMGQTRLGAATDGPVAAVPGGTRP
jgi:hypothetical protein